MAIRVLLDHNVPQERIALLSLLVSKQGEKQEKICQNLARRKIRICFTSIAENRDEINFFSGVQTVAYVFPQVKIVSTACDDEIDLKTGFICPGLGNFGDRFFGTDEYQINESQESFSFEPCLNDSPSDKTSKVSFSLEFWDFLSSNRWHRQLSLRIRILTRNTHHFALSSQVLSKQNILMDARSRLLSFRFPLFSDFQWNKRFQNFDAI